jgi:hypothetical protein
VRRIKKEKNEKKKKFVINLCRKKKIGQWLLLWIGGEDIGGEERVGLIGVTLKKKA